MGTSATETNVGVGPARARLVTSPATADRIRDHFQGFLGSDAADTAFTLIERRTTTQAPLALSTDEVQVRVTDPRSRVFEVNKHLTLRSTLRLTKRLPDIGRWQRSRWLLFLRHAIELPVLASLEFDSGYIPLHAATIYGPDGAVLLLGHNGAGKSTLACRMVNRLGVQLGADNFSPTDGINVINFPGHPKSKPGDNLPTLRTKPGCMTVRAVVTLGITPRERALHTYLSENEESHRSTAWTGAFEGSTDVCRRNDALVASRLARLPSVSYSRDSQSLNAVTDFIGAYCGAQSV